MTQLGVHLFDSSNFVVSVLDQCGISSGRCASPTQIHSIQNPGPSTEQAISPLSTEKGLFPGYYTTMLTVHTWLSDSVPSPPPYHSLPVCITHLTSSVLQDCPLAMHPTSYITGPYGDLLFTTLGNNECNELVLRSEVSTL